MNSGFWLLAQNQGDGGEAAAGIVVLLMLLLSLAVSIALIASQWIIFTKAGKPGWASIIPIYNVVVLLEIIGRPIWWVLLLFIPCVGVVVAVLLMLDLAKSFGKSTGFGIGLLLLGFVFFPILAFSDARYMGPAAK